MPLTNDDGRGGGEEAITGSLPRALQELLRLAAANDDGRELLVLRREEAASAFGVELNETEKAVLRSVPSEQLDEMIRGIARASSSEELDLGSYVRTRGISPDLPPERVEMLVCGGMAPDMPSSFDDAPAAKAPVRGSVVIAIVVVAVLVLALVLVLTGVLAM